MQISNSGIQAIKRREGEKLVVYADSAGYITAGVGHKLTGSTYKVGDVITQAQSATWLFGDLGITEACINSSVKMPLDQNQFDALCSFVFNIGVNAFRSSTMLRLLNAADYSGAAQQFARWCYITKNGIKQVSSGLLNRRMQEAAQFSTADSDDGLVSASPITPPSKALHTTTGKLQVGALATGGMGAVLEGVNQATPVLSSANTVHYMLSGFSGVIKIVAVVFVLACIGFCVWTLIHKHRSL